MKKTHIPIKKLTNKHWITFVVISIAITGITIVSIFLSPKEYLNFSNNASKYGQQLKLIENIMSDK